MVTRRKRSSKTNVTIRKLKKLDTNIENPTLERSGFIRRVEIHETDFSRQSRRITADSGLRIEERLRLDQADSAGVNINSFLAAHEANGAMDDEPISDVDAEQKVKREFRVCFTFLSTFQAVMCPSSKNIPPGFKIGRSIWMKSCYTMVAGVLNDAVAVPITRPYRLMT